jgi:hypothetical protein
MLYLTAYGALIAIAHLTKGDFCSIPSTLNPSTKWDVDIGHYISLHVSAPLQHPFMCETKLGDRVNSAEI